jgi:acetate kinase
MRDVEVAVENGDRSAATALAVWRHRLRSYLGAYIAALGRVDAIVFTAGIGENSPQLRELACQGLEHLGIEIDSSRNFEANKGPREISKDSSSVRVLVIPTNEELEIALQAEEIAKG